ncbi:MAG TPA: 1-deoxy-D-xylulose-5-phosphate synthase [Dehalococcoidia bacterium]|nr:1-deoxy-D-xylulose-5-phosphate synthase [Dehalococcoidia bacterium]
MSCIITSSADASAPYAIIAFLRWEDSLVVLDKIDSPADLKGLGFAELKRLAAEIRQQLIQTVSLNGGHLASNLGVVELTIALHRVFTSPEDKIVWDVGHQCYAHKLLTGRRDKFGTLRQYGGLSGFTTRAESPHDPFGAGHAGTSVSAALGIALARDLNKSSYHVVAIIGDGSLGAGMAFEAVNHAGHLGTKLIVVLNDNGMSISPSVGAMSKLLNQVRFDARYEFAKKKVRKTVARLPFGELAWELSKRIKSRFESVLLPNIFWEQLGFSYLGPVDGHNIKELEAALTRARDFESKPVLVHVLTRKGKGYAVAEANATKFHGVPPNDAKAKDAPSYSQVFGRTVLRLMQQNKRVVAITAAMLDGTGLTSVAAHFPDRVFDVGICEQHAVTLAAGLATQGFIPIVAIYSTFLQRAYDQIIHDVCIQNLPVVFALDRGGIVGDDGKTHQGAFDISYLRAIPNMIIAAPKDEDELQHLLYTAINAGQPVAVRYPRGSGHGVALASDFRLLPLGKGEMLKEGGDVGILAIGSAVYPALTAAEKLGKEGIHCTVANARFAKPLDSELIMGLAASTKRLLTVEENALAGGFGSAVLELLGKIKLEGVKVECLGLPDRFIEHGTQELFRAMFKLDSEGIAKCVTAAFPELVGEASFR